MNVEERIKKMGIVLPEPAAALGMYEPLIITNDLIFTSGNLPLEKGELKFKGKLGLSVSLEEGLAAAQLCTLNALATLKDKIGSLNRILRVVKVTGFVNSTPDFTDHPKVINGASKLLMDLFAEQGLHARSAVGVAALPLDAAVEIEFVFQLAPK